MKVRTLPICLAAAFLIVLLVPSLNADWSDGGTMLCNGSANQTGQQIVSDGADGAIIAWHDDREGSSIFDIYAQRVDSEGNIVWDAGGVNVSQLGSSQINTQLVSDGNGGAIIAYINDRTGNYDITAQRIRSNGTIAWATGGITVCGAANDQLNIAIISDDTGGAIIAWSDYRSGTNWDIYAARIDSTGSMPWTANGVAVCTSGYNQQYPVSAPDGSSGAIIAWTDYRSGNEDIYAQKIIFNGSYAWTNNGNSVAVNSETNSSPSIVSDMNGGAIIAWVDGEMSVKDIMAERMLSDGTAAWNPTYGIGVCTALGLQSMSDIVSDGASGAIITWSDYRNSNGDIYALRIDFMGGTTWNTDGNAVSTDPGTQIYAEIVTDSAGGAFILWTDTRYMGNQEIFGQHIDAGGTTHWYTNGANLSNWPGEQNAVRLVATSDGGFITVWWDLSDPYSPYKLYAQKFDRYGYWGDPAPVITDANDVPADQGGQVLIEWSPVRMDEFPENLITHYTIWRSVSAPAAMALTRDESSGMASEDLSNLFVTSPCEIGLDFEGTAYRNDIAFGAAAAWEWVASVDAQYWDEYAYTCGTLRDFINDLDNGMHYFVITANTADPFTFWNSAPDSAWSVDNLSPCAPMGIAGEQSYQPAGLELSWSPNSETDLGGYNIYRGTDPTFEPNSDNFIGSTCDTFVLDGGWSWDSDFCYKVAAIDIHGNESGYAVLCMDQVTGDDPMTVPDATFLSQNFPNPFNPNTTIAFGLKTDGFVNLSIYNAAGRLVATLINESRPAGQYSAAWNGKVQNGSPAASGVYFYKLNTKELAKTRKMILLK